MRIKAEQTKVFAGQAVRDFERRAVAHLRRDLPDQTKAATDDELLQRVRECSASASSYGLVTQRQIMFFAVASVLLGKDFDKNPNYTWASTLLQSRKVSVTRKAVLLLATACSVYQSKEKK